MRFGFMIVFLFSSLFATSQETKKFDVYKPFDDATLAIQRAVALASKEKKHVLVQIGGNWCSWCARFEKISREDEQIDSLLSSSFVIYHLNYSKENKNLSVLAKYSFPQRFGFPVFLILDSKGKLLHTQNSAYLEDGGGYGKDKVIEFLSSWTQEALDPNSYK